MALTRERIDREISRLTNEKNSFNTERDKYKISLTYANKLLRNIQNSINYLLVCNDNLKKYFTINGKTIDNGKLNIEKNSLSQILKSLNNNIIPDINSNISNLNKKISIVEKRINELKRERENAQI